MDILEHIEAAEAELNRFIERRASTESDPDETEPSYAESVRCYNNRLSEERRASWIDFHERMSRVHTDLAEEHRAAAEELNGGGC